MHMQVGLMFLRHGTKHHCRPTTDDEGAGDCIKKLSSPHGAGLPARLNPDWCRFLTGCLVGEVRAEAEGVPPRDMENSDTGPSYIPLGTALRTASCRTDRGAG